MFSIVINVVDYDILPKLTLFTIEKFLPNTQVILLIDSKHYQYIPEYNKQLSKPVEYYPVEKYNIFKISEIVTNQYYLACDNNFILTKPLFFLDMFTDGKINSTQETITDGGLEYTIPMRYWLSFPHMRNGTCLSLSPQFLLREVAKKSQNLVQYWNQVDKSLYTSNYVLWNPSLCKNVRHQMHPDYQASIANADNSSKFLAICDNAVCDMLFSKIGRDVDRDSLITLLDNFEIYSCNFPFIRLGQQHDGGYVLCDIPSKMLYSYGVGNNYKFEADFVQKYTANCLMFDHTVPQIPEQKNIRHIRVGLDYFKHDCFDTLEHHVQHRSNDLTLKMDIEGYEWYSLLFCDDAILQRFQQIVIELHYLASDCYVPVKTKTLVLQKLNRIFRLVHVHGNNCAKTIEINGLKIHPVLEATFVRKDLIPDAVPKTFSPQPSDSPNNNLIFDIDLTTFYPYKK